MLISVTQGDIERGYQGSPSSCPIARAIRRHVGRENMDIMVRPCGLTGRWMAGYRLRQTVWIPEEAGDFAHRFDNGDPVQPFSFTLDLPHEERRVACSP